MEHPQFMHLNTKCKFSDSINLQFMCGIRGEQRRTRRTEDRGGRYWQSFRLRLMNKFNNNYVMRINNSHQVASLKMFYVIFQKGNYYIHCLWGILICTLKDLSRSSTCSGSQRGWPCTLVKRIVNFGIRRVKFIPIWKCLSHIKPISLWENSKYVKFKHMSISQGLHLQSLLVSH